LGIGHVQRQRGDAERPEFHQRIGPENRFLRYYEASGEDLDHFTKYLQSTGYTFGRHYVPHDAEHKRLGMNADTNRSIKEMLEELLPGQRFETVPRVTEIQTGITATRNVFSSCWFDDTGCKDGIARLQNYRKEWDARNGCWRSTPKHDMNSHGSDAFRQFGQEADNGNQFPAGMAGWRPQAPGSGGFKRRRSGMAV
jgi:hypothetical protein